MHPHSSRRTAAFVLAAAALVAWLAPIRAQSPAAKPVACKVPAELTRFVHPLTRTAQRLATAQPLTIVAIGSSSTAGAGATSPAHSYPSRLAVELQQRFPTSDIKVINRGVNGEETGDMLARLDTQVLAEKPDLIIWQVGTNALLRNRPLEPALAMISDGVKRMKAIGADVVLIDPQFAPKVITKPDHEQMVSLISAAAKQSSVEVFHRFAVMRHWRETDGLPFDVFLSPDELHMNDWSYACQARVLSDAIAEASSRSRAIAQTPSVPVTRVSGGR